jgi:pimeloyl-ACP methyl ester carboxylesterase
MSIQYISRPGLPKLAYQAIEGANPALPPVLFCGGYRSDMEGTKAQYLARQCAARGQAYVRFDYSGHGLSEGRFEDCTVSIWRDDAFAVLNALARRPVVIVGSSLGGWISLLLARDHPEKVAGIVGIAAAPDFTRILWSRLSEAQRKTIMEKGRIEIPSEYAAEPYVFTKALIEDGEKNCLLDKKTEIAAPVSMQQSMEVPVETCQAAHKN